MFVYFPSTCPVLNLGYTAGPGTVTEWPSFDSKQNLNDHHSHTLLAGDLSDLWGAFHQAPASLLPQV